MTLPAAATDRVLPTLNPDGTRRWIRPRLFPGRFFRRRRALAWALIASATLTLILSRYYFRGGIDREHQKL